MITKATDRTNVGSTAFSGLPLDLYAGIDEVGLGAWAGPVVAAAVLLPLDWPHARSMRDSKALSPARRRELAKLIRAECLIGFGAATQEAVDSLGLASAHAFAIWQAASCLEDALRPTPPYPYIIDGSPLPMLSGNRAFMDGRSVQFRVRADQSVPAVSAASIVAKVHRDAIMAGLNQQYPHYGFAKNMGYGTVQHRLALEKHGLCPAHRKSYKPIAAIARSFSL